jgi:5-methylcytosine-specific restriction endonuclease McrA
MGKYRCAGCHEYFHQPEHRRFGISRVCSDRCAELYSNAHCPQRSLAKGSRRAPQAMSADATQGHPIPTAVRGEVLTRDRSRCRYCGGDGHHVHHVCYRSEGIDHQPHNLITLCREHHDLVHSNKRVYKPLLLATIWFEYVERRHLTVMQVQRILLRHGYILTS